ncbi:cytochrome P450 [Mycena maculata]|uniref:Cytochrome P450 n=1 Tax=Mycena maculata TaxID=230809 RepID=A0AAD7ID36_9AGAR|nr:cytochrome P450 [Mycena maculata]
MPVAWQQGKDHDKISIFARALSVASTTLIHRLIFPKWLWKLPIQSLRDIDNSWKTVITLLDALATSRQAQYSSEKALGKEHARDLFTELISATDGDTKYALEPPEVELPIKNLGEVNKLKYVLACMHEAHRLVPATINLPRDAPEDIIIHSTRPVEEDVLVRQGSRIIIDIMAVCHNPHDFPDPEAYKPARWHDVPDHEVIMFGAGPRSCVGRRFAQTEAVAFLAHFLRDWEVETVVLEGETKEACFERIMAGASMYGTAFGLGEVPVKIKARTLS